ncbi:hypothetical protein I308_104005 [Cryptococcus tetragattii IND107]|uniref:Uncharacterized protein n=1 Tax=Cryptococcus tetragattii IND107 TaxID=1296105 RepID=A0ABR3BST6_9TREE
MAMSCPRTITFRPWCRSEYAQYSLLQNHSRIATEIERLVRVNKFEYRRMEGELNESIINSHYPAFGLPYHAIRLASFVSPSTCSRIVGLFEEVQKTKAYKFKPESKRHGGAIHDSEAAPFHFGIVRRRGNGTRYTKDARVRGLGG